MPLSLLELTRLATTVARTYDRALQVVGVASNDAGSGRVELLVTIAGCHSEPCTLLLNLPRDERLRFETELSKQLRDALQAHQLRSDG